MIFDTLAFLFGSSYKNRARRDRYNPNTALKNLISPVNNYGTCFKCDGTGYKIIPAKKCFTCNGTGIYHVHTCRKCSGTGEFKAEKRLTCNKCDGNGWHKY